MTASSLSDALVHLQAAISALSNEAEEHNPVLGTVKRLPPIESCIGEDLIQIDRRIGAKQPTLIGAIGASIIEVMVELVAAEALLSGLSGDRKSLAQGARGSLEPTVDQIGLRLEISAARISCAVARAEANPDTADDIDAQIESHEKLRVKYRAALHRATGSEAELIERRLAL